jgi:hypothetical protein
MRDMMNVAFQNAWFGPFVLPNTVPKCQKIIGPMGHPVYQDPECEEHAGAVYDDGPFDGLRTTSMWAQRFAQMPIVNYAQARPNMAGPRMGQEPVFCEPGFVPMPTGVPGQSRCVQWSPPSSMLGPGSQVPPSYGPNQLTYPVKAFYGWDKRGM